LILLVQLGDSNHRPLIRFKCSCITTDCIHCNNCDLAGSPSKLGNGGGENGCESRPIAFASTASRRERFDNTAAWQTPEAYASLMQLVPYRCIGEPEDIGDKTRCERVTASEMRWY
jgi:hypothetical protein